MAKHKKTGDPNTRNLDESTEAKAIAADLAKLGNGNRPHKPGMPSIGEPSEIQLAWYHEWTVKHRSLTDIANDAGVTRSAVHQGVHRAKEWIKLEVFNDILDFRHRHTETLEKIVSEALLAWERSKEIGVTEEFESITVDGETEDDLPRDATKTKRKEVHQCGSASFLDEARSALNDIRGIWGVDAPKKTAITFDDEMELLPVEGLTPEEAIRQEAHRMLESIGDAIPVDSGSKE